MAAGPGQRILVVDDAPASLVTFKAMLKETGADIVTAESGAEALALCQEHDFALAVVDVHMPEMDGYELAERMRGGIQTAQVPIIFATGGEADENLEFEGYAAGAVDFLRKPASPRILVAKANIFLELHEQRVKLERAAREWQTTFDGMTDLIALIDTDRHVLQCNQAMCDFLGMSRDAICGKTCAILVHGDSGVPGDCPYSRMIESKRKETSLLPFGDRLFEVTVHPVFDDRKKLVSAVHIVRDITEQSRAEGELRAFNSSMVEREMRIVEMKKEVNALAAELGREPPYPPVWE